MLTKTNSFSQHCVWLPVWDSSTLTDTDFLCSSISLKTSLPNGCTTSNGKTRDGGKDSKAKSVWQQSIQRNIISHLFNVTALSYVKSREGKILATSSLRLPQLSPLQCLWSSLLRSVIQSHPVGLPFLSRTSSARPAISELGDLLKED